MREDTPELNSCTWRWMYHRNASLDHLPMSMIVKTGTPARYMAMADPERMECVPNSRAVNPSTSSPTDFTLARSLFNSILEESWDSLLSVPLIVQTGVVSPVPS